LPPISCPGEEVPTKFGFYGLGNSFCRHFWLIEQDKEWKMGLLKGIFLDEVKGGFKMVLVLRNLEIFRTYLRSDDHQPRGPYFLFQIFDQAGSDEVVPQKRVKVFLREV
jgi:hypothetical protein